MPQWLLPPFIFTKVAWAGNKEVLAKYIRDVAYFESRVRIKVNIWRTFIEFSFRSPTTTMDKICFRHVTRGHWSIFLFSSIDLYTQLSMLKAQVPKGASLIDILGCPLCGRTIAPLTLMSMRQIPGVTAVTSSSILSTFHCCDRAQSPLPPRSIVSVVSNLRGFQSRSTSISSFSYLRTLICSLELRMFGSKINQDSYCSSSHKISSWFEDTNESVSQHHIKFKNLWCHL